MFNKFGVFINLDYAHKSADECSIVWQKVMDLMLSNGFSFEKRVFIINTTSDRDEIATNVRKLLDEIRLDQHDLYSYINDCYILNFQNCIDLTLPDTSNAIDVEDVSEEDLEALGVEYDISDPTLFGKK